MESLVLSMTEILRGLLGDVRWILFGVAALIVGVLGVLAGRRLTREVSLAAAPEGGPDLPGKDRNDGDLVTPSRRRRPGDAKSGKIAAMRWTLRGLGLTGIALVASLVALDGYGTEPILRWSLAKLEPRTGIKLTFSKVTGGLLSGQFVLHQVRAVRVNHPESNFDLICSQVTARCSLWKILSPRVAIDGVRLEQVSGTYHRVRKAPIAAPAGTAPAPAPAPLAARARGVWIGQLQLVDATIDYTDSTVEGDPVQVALAVESLECAPVRSAQAPFDLIFRSNATGTIDGRPFVVKTTRLPAGTKTEWGATGLPMALVRAYLEGPFRWLRSGECDVSIAQQMPDDQTVPVTLETHLILREIRPGVPEGTKPGVAIAAQLLISQLKNLPKEKDIGFTLKVDPKKFDLTKTEDREHFWKQFKAAAVAGLLQSTPVGVDGLSDETNEKLDRAVDNVANQAMKAIEKIRARRQARKAAKEKQAPPAPPVPQP